MMNRFPPLLAAGLSVMAALAAIGCSVHAEPHESGRSLFVFLDLSASITSAQRALWEREGARLANGLPDDSSIAIYAIHDHTMDTARLFEAEIPAPLADGTRSAAEKQKAARKAAREGALAAILGALDSGGDAQRTDIFSAINRIRPPRDGRHLQIIFFSDMLNSTPDFNMELPGSLARSNLMDRVAQLAQRHSWHSAQLAGAEVYCVLNSISSGKRGPAIDRLTQQAFYQALFESLGARLISYDTNISARAAAPVEGGRDVAETR